MGLRAQTVALVAVGLLVLWTGIGGAAWSAAGASAAEADARLARQVQRFGRKSRVAVAVGEGLAHRRDQIRVEPRHRRAIAGHRAGQPHDREIDVERAAAAQRKRAPVDELLARQRPAGGGSGAAA